MKTKREKVLKVRVSETELSTLRANAEAGGLATSSYLRSTGLRRHIKAPIDIETRKNLSRWSQNLNSLAHRACLGIGDPAAVATLTAEARELVKQIGAVCRN